MIVKFLGSGFKHFTNHKLTQEDAIFGKHKKTMLRGSKVCLKVWTSADLNGPNLDQDLLSKIMNLLPKSINLKDWKF